MRFSRVSFVFLFLLAFISACGTQDTSSQAANSGIGARSAQCDEIFLLHADGCDDCARRECCAEISACAGASPDCLLCAWERPDNEPKCAGFFDVAAAVGNCIYEHCYPICGGAPPSDGARYGVDPTVCKDTEMDGSISLAECAERNISILRGTVDGVPYDRTFSQATDVDLWAVDIEGRWGVSLPAEVDGTLSLYWRGFATYDNPVCVVGEIQLPGESRVREIKPGSKLWNHPGQVFQYSLLLDTDKLMGCTQY